MRKKFLSFVFCCLLLASTTQALAAESKVLIQPNSTTVMPRMDYIVQASGNLYIDSSGNATVECDVYGYQGITTKVEISAKLQQYKNGNWVTLKTYVATSKSHRTSLSETYSISSGYSYRVQANIKAYSGSKVETQTVTSGTAKY